MPVIGYPIIQLLWFLFVYTFDMGWKRKVKFFLLKANFFFFKENARQDIKDQIE